MDGLALEVDRDPVAGIDAFHEVHGDIGGRLGDGRSEGSLAKKSQHGDDTKLDDGHGESGLVKELLQGKIGTL